MTPIEEEAICNRCEKKNRMRKVLELKEQVNQLMKQFDQMSKMMKMMQGPEVKSDEDDGRHERNARKKYILRFKISLRNFKP
jgi:signal recognition particle GTPase